MNHQASVTSRGSEQRALPSAGSNSEVFVGELRGNPAAGCAVQESNLDQEGLVDFLDRLRLFGEGGSQCVHAYWSALVFLDYRQQQLAVDVIETVAVNFQHLERGLCGGVMADDGFQPVVFERVIQECFQRGLQAVDFVDKQNLLVADVRQYGGKIAFDLQSWT